MLCGDLNGKEIPKRGDICVQWAYQVALAAKNLPANAEAAGDMCSIPESGTFPGEGHDNPLQYSCLENPMDRGAWWTTVYGNTESDTTERPTLSLLLPVFLPEKAHEQRTGGFLRR